MYADHQGGQSLRTVFSAPEITYDRDGKRARFWSLRGSASLRDKQFVLTVVNPDVGSARESEILVRGASIQSGTVTTLTHSDIHAHNSFEQRNMVSPQTKALDGKGRSLTVTFKAASVTKLVLALV
jgi:alpha-N-arabinofuranosidase